MVRKKELDWFYQIGASKIFPEFWQDFINPIPKNEQNNLLAAYYKRLTGDEENVKLTCAKAWALWEAKTSRLKPNVNFLHKVDKDKFALAFSRIECHYFVNKGFFKNDDWLLNQAGNIRHLKCVIIHGRYNLVN